jgi:hypothetical protein
MLQGVAVSLINKGDDCCLNMIITPVVYLSLSGTLAVVGDAEADEAAARATHQAMQATAEAVARLRLQGRAAGPAGTAQNGHGDGGMHGPEQQNGGCRPEPEAAPPGEPGLGLQPADSGYLADTEGLPAKGAGPGLEAHIKHAASNGVRQRAHPGRKPGQA